MNLIKNISYVFLGAATAMMTLPSVSMAMGTEEWESPQEFIKKTYRIQLFSLPKEEGRDNAHAQLEEMRERAPKISDKLALLATEKGSKWIRGQIGPFANKEEVVSIRTELREIFTVDLPTVSAPGIVHQLGFELENAEWYNWK